VIIGYRDFALHYGYKGFRLRACSNAYVWDVGVNEAQCSHGPEPASDHLAAGSCTCGFYAYKERSQLNRFTPLHGAVLLWGKVIEHEFGYRAQFAQVESLFLPEIATCQKASHSAHPADLHVFIDMRPIDPFTACSACLSQLLDSPGICEFCWQSLSYNEVLSELARTYSVSLIRQRG